MLEKVISGCQTGADIAGLKAAKLAGLDTGGFISAGFRTLDGKKPEYARTYGITELPTWQYPPRTEANVKNSDGTIRFASDWNSAGELLTMKLIKKHKKPSLSININELPEVEVVHAWLDKHNITVLNVAGNSEQTSPGIEQSVARYLYQVFQTYEPDESRQEQQMLF